MAQIVQITTEQLNQLLEAVKNATSSASGGQHEVKGPSRRNFDNCSIFAGERDPEIVESFIKTVESFKEIENISDEDALKSIPMLFYGMASTWWQVIRKEVKCWNDVPRLLREHFSPSKPNYQIYMEFFSKKQDNKTPIDTYVCQQRALLTQLPDGRHDEETEIDMIFGLLNIKYRKYIVRHGITSFRDLLEKGRVIEHTNTEEEEAAQQQKKNGRNFRKVKRCTNCNYRGHTYQECRKRRNQEQNDNDLHHYNKRARTNESDVNGQSH